MKELFEMLKNGGKIVSTAELNNYDIASARACGRMYVDEDGFGFVYFPKSEPNCTIPDLGKRLSEMEEAGKEATSLIAHLKDQHGFNEVEEEAQQKIMKVFKYEGRW